MKLLVVEDDPGTADALRRGLEREGFTVEVAADGLEGLWRAREGHPDVIVLDVMLPGRNGYLVCRDLRAEGNWTPILMLTAKGGELDETEGLETGADDYLVKPFSFAVLVARIHALARRAETRHPSPTTVGDLRLDPAARRGWRAGTELRLSRRQFDVLEYLVRRAGRVVAKDELLEGVWPDELDRDPNLVEAAVRRLRRTVDEPFGRCSIQTVRGVGYRIVDDRTGP